MSLFESIAVISASFLAEISVSSPRKLFILLSIKYFLDQSIQKIFYLLLKKEALAVIQYRSIPAQRVRC